MACGILVPKFPDQGSNFGRAVRALSPYYWASREFPLISILDLIFKQSSVVQSCLTLGPHGLQHVRLPCPSPTLGAYSTHVSRVSDAIQPSHPLSSPSPPAFNLSQHQGLFQGVRSSHQVAKVLMFQLLASVLTMNIQD